MWHSGKESTCKCRRHRFHPWVGKPPGVGNDNPLQCSCLENSMDRGAWWAIIHGAARSQTQLRMHSFILGFLGGTMVKNLPANVGDARAAGLIPRSGKSPGVGNGSPSSILAWKIPWTEEPGGLQSMGPQGVRHNWATEHTCRNKGQDWGV